MWRSYIYEILGARGGEFCGPAWRSQYSDSEQSGDQFLVGVRYSVPIQTIPRASLLYCIYQVIPWGKAARAWRWQPPPSSAEVKKSRAVPLLPFQTFMVVNIKTSLVGYVWYQAPRRQRKQFLLKHVPTIRQTTLCHIPEETTNNIKYKG